MKPRAIAMLILGAINAAGVTVLAQGGDVLNDEAKIGIGGALAAIGFLLASLNSTRKGHVFEQLKPSKLKAAGKSKARAVLPLVLAAPLLMLAMGCGTARVRCLDLQLGETMSIHCEVDMSEVDVPLIGDDVDTDDSG
jgi:hypothetical protein